jgi:beta-galactosidase
MGLNTVQTFAPWNAHEPTPGVYDFSGNLDIVAYLQLLQKYNMHMTLRAGPYMDGEWDFGGIPWWLEQFIPAHAFRSSDPAYLKYVDRWMTILLKKVAPYMYHTNGGPIILVQVENEYGLYRRCDLDYMRHLTALFQQILGKETVLTTVENPNWKMLECGTISGLLFATVDFAVNTNPEMAFGVQRKWNNNSGPYYNVECWTGWIDHWGVKHHTVPAEKFVTGLDKMLALGASVNIYIGAGASDPGWWPGSNSENAQDFEPIPNSYDFDAPVSEAGDLTWKYTLIRRVISKYRSDIPDYHVKNYTKKAYGKFDMSTLGLQFWDALPYIIDRKQHSDKPLTFEQFGQGFGFVLYETQLPRDGLVDFGHINDRAYVFLNKNRAGIIETHKEYPIQLSAGQLDVLVENQGRNCFGPDFVQPKGLVSGVSLNGEAVTGWDHYGISIPNVSAIPFIVEFYPHLPCFFTLTFTIQEEPEDTFFNPSGWGRGNVWINDYHLGKYWTVGPQLTLYIPKHLLKKGTNILTMLELEKHPSDYLISLDDHPQLDIIP